MAKLSRKLNIIDFDIKYFNSWDVFAELMHNFYVNEPWFFGYKCPKCDKDDFTITDNPKIEGQCHRCLSNLTSFFSPERTKKYFSQNGFKGKVVTNADNSVVGWILGFKEKLKDYNESFPDYDVFNIGYLCILPQYRKRNSKIEKIRQFLGIAEFKGQIPSFITRSIYFIIGDSPVIKLHNELIKSLSKDGFKYVTSKISKHNKHLEKFTRYTGYRKIGPWKKDSNKNIWIKKIL